MRNRHTGTGFAVVALALFVAAGFLAGTGDLLRAVLAAALAVSFGLVANHRRGLARRRSGRTVHRAA